MIVMDRLVSVKEVAQALGVSEETVKRWLRKRIVPGVKMGKSWRVKESVLADLREHGTPQESEQG